MFATKSKDKIVDREEGKITILEKEDRYPWSTEVLMRNGFCIILLNMIFGLLPTTLYGSRLKFYKASIAVAYAVMFGFCISILSFLFVPVTLIIGLQDALKNGERTDAIVLVLVKITHVCGFMLLLLRGFYTARKLQKVWQDLAKLVQISVIELHGHKYKELRRMRRYSFFAVAIYLILMVGNEFDIFQAEVVEMMPEFFAFYEIPAIAMSGFNFVCLQAGYMIWQLCSVSHILVSILVGFLIVTVTVCLRAGNDHLKSIFKDEIGISSNNSSTTTLLDALDLDIPVPTAAVSPSSQKDDKIKILTAINRVKDIHATSETVIGSISRYFGVSLIIEVLILITNLLVNIYFVIVPLTFMNSQMPTPNNWNDTTGNLTFSSFNSSEPEWDSSGQMPENQSLTFTGVLSLLGQAFIHSYFFYKLCCRTTEMVNEAKVPLNLLKSIPYRKYTKEVEREIEKLKQDLTSTSVSLTAANYFQINKFTLTSVTSALTTYIIVLIQFNAQDNQSAFR